MTKFILQFSVGSINGKPEFTAKIQIFLWLVWHNAIPTRGTLLKRELSVDPLCLMYLSDIESIDHFFITCPMTTKTWDMAKDHQWLLKRHFQTLCVEVRDELHGLYLAKTRI